MATKTFCDRCGEDITDRVHTIDGALDHPNEPQDNFSLELCDGCCREVKRWLTEKAPRAAVRR